MPGPWWVWVFALLSVASAVLNCTVETHDPVATPCCVAQDAWDHLVAGGGCGGSGPTEAQCSAAMELCLDCQAAVEYYAHNATALKASDITVDISSAKIKCALPEWNGACTGTVKGLGVGLLILTGVALLVVATAACIAFDWRLLPSLVAWQRRKLLVEAIATQDAEARTDRGSESASPSAPLPPKPVPPAPPTPTARPPAQGFDKQPDTLRIAADAPEAESLAASPTSPASLPPNEAAVPSSAGEALALGRAQPELPPTLASQRRPRHYASAYALHTAFITIAVIAVVLRIAYVVARGLLVVGLQLAHTCLPELLLCILPLAWVSCTSRRPKSSTTAVPMSVAYWGPWQAIPRFTTYAVCTICTEIYSTLVAALAVARLPCNASPIAGVLLYCVGLLVAVVRAYCAVLALRLQDELASVCRRARPIRPSRGEATNPPLEAAWDAPHRQGQLDERARAARAAKISKARMTSLFGWMGDRDVIEDTVRDFNEPDDPAKAALACPFLPAFVCPVLRRRLVGRRILAGGILLALLSASASAFVIKAVLGEQRPSEERLSSCDATQNGTSTCAAWELAGVNVTDPQTGIRKMDLASTITECCKGCDEVKGCQGWIFTHLDKRCRWVHFVDEVCKENPGALSCRCFTSRGIAFSFKPPAKTNLIWVDTNWD